MNALDNYKNTTLYRHTYSIHQLSSNILQNDIFYKTYNGVLELFDLSILSLNLQIRLYSFYLER